MTYFLAILAVGAIGSLIGGAIAHWIDHRH